MEGWREGASGPLGRSTPGHRKKATEAVGHQARPPGAFEQRPREREGFTQQQAEALRTRALHRLSLSPRVAGGVTPLGPQGFIRLLLRADSRGMKVQRGKQLEALART